MVLARVEGSVISTVRHSSLKGWRLLICQLIDEENRPVDLPFIALDDLGAGKHDRVVVTSDGKSIRDRVGDPYSPARYMIQSIVDPAPAGHDSREVAE